MEAPEFGYFSPEKRHSGTKTTGDNFIVEDLLDFSNDDGIITDGTFDMMTGGNSTDSCTVSLVDSCNSSSAGNDPHFISSGGCGGDIVCRSFATADTHFSGDLCVPYDDVAQLEWLSHFVEESFSSGDLQRPQLISGISGIKTRPEARQNQPDLSPNTTSRDSDNDANVNNNSPIFSPEMPVPGKARSKRSRGAPCNWTSRLLVLSPNAIQTQTQQTSSSESDMVSAVEPKPVTKPDPRRRAVEVAAAPRWAGANCEGRKCLHCATDKTPQWRTGPMGPKTLCNACGVRYKSGRLVPEYRPAASPTFVLTKHSNSHRKVMELRRQKELMRQQQLEQQEQQLEQQFIHANLMFDGSTHDDYLIHQHIGPDFRQLI
ncbi:hypothetical protein Ancab_002109 [Ancistrocladus abbreviatus]